MTINYFSPYLVIDSAFSGIVNGSLVAFGSMFVGSLFLGRLWCGWACPAGGLQDAARGARDRRVGRRVDRVKWVIWIPWVAIIALGALRAGGYSSVDLFYGTVNGISVAGSADRPIFYAYVIYFFVIFLFLGLALALGRRGGCHSVCWMAPFMIIGRWITEQVRLARAPAGGEPAGMFRVRNLHA